MLNELSLTETHELAQMGVRVFSTNVDRDGVDREVDLDDKEAALWLDQWAASEEVVDLYELV
jgi:predicted HTH domain antitoxin